MTATVIPAKSQVQDTTPEFRKRSMTEEDLTPYPGHSSAKPA